jgi:hypothetical protein
MMIGRFEDDVGRSHLDAHAVHINQICSQASFDI